MSVNSPNCGKWRKEIDSLKPLMSPNLMTTGKGSFHAVPVYSRPIQDDTAWNRVQGYATIRRPSGERTRRYNESLGQLAQRRMMSFSARKEGSETSGVENGASGSLSFVPLPSPPASIVNDLFDQNEMSSESVRFGTPLDDDVLGEESG